MSTINATRVSAGKQSDEYAPDTFKDVSTVAIGSIATVWTPAAGKKIRWLGASISTSAAVSILFEDNAGGAFLFRTPSLLLNTPYELNFGPRGILLAAAGNVLKATSSGAANLLGTLWGVEE